MLQTANMVQQASRNQFEVEKMSLAKCQLYNHHEKFPSALSAAEPSPTLSNSLYCRLLITTSPF